MLSTALVVAAMPVMAADLLESLPACTLVEADWADGDSFPVKTADGRELTVRLYGADCIEAQVRNETDARRLRAQRRWFGITNAGASPELSIALAKELGRAAAAEVRALLAEPFTVHTAWADGRGDPRFTRHYAFVTTAAGEDLASLLVARGLARAFGVYRGAPGGVKASDYRGRLRDLELQAAKRGLGAWALTDWDSLPEERQLARAEEAEIELAIAPPVDPDFVIDPNTAARDELMRLPGIGEVLAMRIIEGRPYQRIDDLGRVPGIGEKTLEKIRPHLMVGHE